MTAATEEVVKKAAEAGLTVVSIEDLEKEGAEHPSEKASVTGDSIATICYTSGTTGLPKGALLTHTNILSFAAGVYNYIDMKEIYNFSSEEVYLSYLPLAHIFERIVLALITNKSGRVGFYQGDTLKLMDDLAELKPTVFASVPRLYNRIYDKINAGVNAKVSNCSS
jgi:long-chain acyl-CoA synthetase